MKQKRSMMQQRTKRKIKEKDLRIKNSDIVASRRAVEKAVEKQQVKDNNSGKI